MTAPVLYMDASAVVKLRLDEPESVVLERRVGGCRLISSAIVEVEVTRAVRRVVTGDLYGSVMSAIGLLVMDRSTLRLAASLGPPQLRTLDAIHLASALQVAADLDAFITYDRQLGQAAAAAGLPVESPR